jgi:hypothetical protein
MTGGLVVFQIDGRPRMGEEPHVDLLKSFLLLGQ